MLLSKQLMVLIDFHSVFIFPYYENIYIFCENKYCIVSSGRICVIYFLFAFEVHLTQCCICKEKNMKIK